MSRQNATLTLEFTLTYPFCQNKSRTLIATIQQWNIYNSNSVQT